MKGRITQANIESNRRNNAAIGNGMYAKAREYTRKKKFFTSVHMARDLRIEGYHASSILSDFHASGELVLVSEVSVRRGKPLRVFKRARP